MIFTRMNLCTTRISIPFMKTERNVYGLELTKTEYCSINQINKKLFTYPLVYSTIHIFPF